MCLEESFCPFTRDALNFRQPKVYAAPYHPAVIRFALSLNRHYSARDAPLCHAAQLPLMLTGKAESSQIICLKDMSM